MLAGPCSNRLTVRRTTLTDALVRDIKVGPSDPAVVGHVRRELTRRLRRKAPKIEQRRMRELQATIDNLADAIGAGALRGSPALAEWLAVPNRSSPASRCAPRDLSTVERLLPRLDTLFLAKVRELETAAEREPLRARQALQESVETPIRLAQRIGNYGRRSHCKRPNTRAAPRSPCIATTRIRKSRPAARAQGAV
jgi:hypothetical protein